MNSQAADPLLARVRKLLAKAEDAGVTPAEAQALTAKAAELMAKYGIDRALLAAERPETDRPADRVIDVGNPWARVQAHLLCGLASALRCQCVILPRPGPGSRIHMFGFASDLERTDVLYTSLLVQMWQGLAAAQVPAWSRSPRAWRRSWLLGFATAVVARVRAAEQEATSRATAPDGPLRVADGAGPRRPRPGHPPQHRAGLPRHPQVPGDLQRQRLRRRLRAGPAGRHRHHPPARLVRVPSLGSCWQLPERRGAGRGRWRRCRAGAARTARTCRRAPGSAGRAPRRARRARRARPRRPARAGHRRPPRGSRPACGEQVT